MDAGQSRLSSSPAGGWLRGITFAVGVGGALLSAALLLRLPIATQAWPVQVTPLTYTFLSAYVLGFVAAVVWVAATAEMAGLQGIGLTVAVAFGSMSAVLVGMLGTRPELLVMLVGAIGMCLAGLVTLAIGLRRPVRDARLTPPALRVACLIVAGLLLTLGVPLTLRVADVIPWSLDLDSGALIGGMFLGSAAYFAHGALRGPWPHVAGPLAALLAYDVVLTVPLLAHLPTARPEHVTVLVLYISVLAATALLGAYVFLVDKRTRVA